VLARWRRRAALAAAALAAFNGAVLVLTLWRGIALENCGCFGVFLARPAALDLAVRGPGAGGAGPARRAAGAVRRRALLLAAFADGESRPPARRAGGGWC
jgi:hypothetical protein